MKFYKTILFIATILISQFAFAKQVINPFTINQQQYKVQKIAKGTEKTFKAQGGFPYLIPDNDPEGITIPIDMTGLFQGNVTSIKLALDIEHTFLGDLSAKLVSPDGLAELILFARVDSSSSINGEYIFSDEAMNDLWAVSSSNQPLPVDEYRTSTAGIVNDFFYANNHGGCTTYLGGAFNGLTPEQSNGIWTLEISDNANQDIGQVNAASIIFSFDEDTIFQDKFEPLTSVPFGTITGSDVTGSCRKAQYDFSGTGFSDYVLLWESQDGSLMSFMYPNTGIDSVNVNTPFLDIGSRIQLPYEQTIFTSGGDFDGDGIKDLVFQTPFNETINQYLIYRSSRFNDLPVRLLTFAPADNENFDLQIGDYSGDGIDDFGWIITDNITPSPASLIYLDSGRPAAFQINTGLTGITSDFKAAAGFDQNGDNRADIVMLSREAGGDDYHLNVINAFDESILYTNDGTLSSNTQIAAGTFRENGLNSLAFLSSDNSFNWNSYFYPASMQDLTLLDSANLGGDVNNDIPVTGDYDGDGIDDFGYWDTSAAEFVIRMSSDPATIRTIELNGVLGTDFPMANIRIR